MDSLKKLIVITGASSGIGAATASCFSQKGYPLLLLSRRVDKMKELNLPKSLCLNCDVTNFNQVMECVEGGIKKFGPVDCLVNNAGVMLQHMNPAEQKIEEWNKMIEVNCKGVLNGIKAVLPSMKDRKEGTIVNISSVAGKRTRVAASVYCGTKFFVHTMTENMREELAQDNVRMITVAPGAVGTEMHSHVSDPKAKKRLEELFAMFTPLKPEKVAESIWFAYNMPQDCCVREIVIAPTKQP